MNFWKGWLLNSKELPDGFTDQNAIVFTATYNHLVDSRFIDDLILNQFVMEPGVFKQTPESPNVASHDNVTAILSLMEYPVKLFPNYLHPRDIAFYCYRHPKLYRKLLGIPFFWLSWLIAINTCSKKYMVRPTLYHHFEHYFKFRTWKGHTDGKLSTFINMCKYRIKNGKWEGEVKQLESGNKILFWLRALTGFYPKPILKLCVYILKKHHGNDPIRALLEIYYKEPNHPIREFLRRERMSNITGFTLGTL